MTVIDKSEEKMNASLQAGKEYHFYNKILWAASYALVGFLGWLSF